MDSYDSQCYEIAQRTYDFVMTYMGNRTINMTLVMLFLIINKTYVGNRTINMTLVILFLVVNKQDIRGKSYDKYDPCYAVPRR